MGKYDLGSVINDVKESYGKDQKRANAIGLGSNLESISQNPEDYVVLPDWFKSNFGIMGLPFGKWVQISGRPDAGKTSLSLLSIKNALEQGHAVIYVETEDKTGPEDLAAAGIDENEIITIRESITERIFSTLNHTLDAFFDKYPDGKLLLVIDSYGNTSSLRDAELDQTQKVAQVGGAAKSNRLGLGAIKARQTQYDIAMLVVNYSYANIGSVGETNAGGRALEFYSSLIINASRKAWYERTVNGVKVRAGADVLWKTTKNHFAKALKDDNGESLLLPKQCVLRISDEGFKPLT